MRTLRTRALTTLTAGAIAAASLLPAAGAAAHEVAPQDTPRAVAAARAATAKYHDVDVALADGFVPASGCVSSPAGGMGFHYVKPDRLDDVLVVEEPEALLYEQDATGRVRLIGVEYMVVPSPGQHPTFGGEHLHQADHLPFEVLHVWLWKRNPAGTFADWNPRVSC